MSRVDLLRNTIKKSRNIDSSTFATSLRNKTKTDIDVYNNPEFWENHDINNDGEIKKSKAFDFIEASARFEKFKNQSQQSKGGKRKSRKQRNKSRKQKR
jgi:hypothetical protein